MEDLDFRFKDIVEHAKDIVIVTKAEPIDGSGPEIVYVNHSFTDLTGYTAQEVIGKTPRILQSAQTLPDTKFQIKEALKKQVPIRTIIRNRTKDGRYYWLDISILPLKNDIGQVTHYVAIERDVSEQKELEAKLEKMSLTDSLTELANRRAFNEILANEFSRFRRDKIPYTLLMIDIDYFKNINDTYGHDTGDAILQSLAKLYQSHSRQHDTIARLGGEEFCIILPSTTKNDALKFAHNLCQLISENDFEVDNKNIPVTVSIGIGEVKEDDYSCYDALKRADQKLYEAKASGRNQVYS